jgi:hypothetical protein
MTTSSTWVRYSLSGVSLKLLRVGTEVHLLWESRTSYSPSYSRKSCPSFLSFLLPPPYQHELSLFIICFITQYYTIFLFSLFPLFAASPCFFYHAPIVLFSKNFPIS